MQIAKLSDLELSGLMGMLVASQAAAHLTGFGPLLGNALVNLVNEAAARGLGAHEGCPALFGPGAAVTVAQRPAFSALIGAMCSDLARNGFPNAAAVLRAAARGEVKTEVPAASHLRGRETRLQ